MLGVSESAATRNFQYLLPTEKLMKGVPAAYTPLSATSKPGRMASSKSSLGKRNVIARVEAGAALR